jgi:hypothetical protein
MPSTLVVAERTVNAGVVVASSNRQRSRGARNCGDGAGCWRGPVRPVASALSAVSTWPLVPTVRFASVVAALAAIMSPLV